MFRFSSSSEVESYMDIGVQWNFVENMELKCRLRLLLLNYKRSWGYGSSGYVEVWGCGEVWMIIDVYGTIGMGKPYRLICMVCEIYDTRTEVYIYLLLSFYIQLF